VEHKIGIDLTDNMPVDGRKLTYPSWKVVVFVTVYMCSAVCFWI